MSLRRAPSPRPHWVPATRTSASARIPELAIVAVLRAQRGPTHRARVPHGRASSALPAPSLPCLSSPVSVSVLADELRDHPDESLRQFLISGFTYGFRISFRPDRVPRLRSASVNMGSALRNPQVVDDYLAREVHLGRVAGPFPTPPLPSLHISRFGVIPKRGRPGRWRLIVDLSHPPGQSVNGGIAGDELSLSYARVDDAIDFIVHEGRGTLLAKVDIRDAYRLVPIHPEDRTLLGMAWGQGFYVDLALPFVSALPRLSLTSLPRAGTGSSNTTTASVSFSTIWMIFSPLEHRPHRSASVISTSSGPPPPSWASP